MLNFIYMYVHNCMQVDQMMNNPQLMQQVCIHVHNYDDNDNNDDDNEYVCV